MEIKILIEAPGLEKALNHAADALESIGAISIEPSAIVEADKPETPKDSTVNQQSSFTEDKTDNAVLMPTTNPTVPNAAEVQTVPPVTTAAPAIEPIAANEAVVSTAQADAVSETSAKPVTREQVAMAGAALLDAGKMDELVALLGEFKVQAITQLNDEQVPLVAEKLRAMGAKL